MSDELGAALIAAQIVRDLMSLCFLIEKRYIPYLKWFGTAFSRLTAAPMLTPLFEATLAARDWHEREVYLSQAYQIVAEKHDALNITEPLPTKVSQFHNRPFLVIHGNDFSAAINRTIVDEEVNRPTD